jgi:hypothetical protein
VKTIRLACLAIGLVAAHTLAVGPPPRPLLSSEVEKLVQQMGDRNYALRDQAERRLRAEGLAALPFLRKAIGHQDPEIRRRALRMVPGLEHAALVAPKRITMNVHNQTIANVLAEVSKQSGYKVLFMDNNFMPGMPGAPAKGLVEKRYSFTFVTAPFWDVIDKICRDSNMVINANWGDDAIRLTPATGHSVHAGRDGAFRYSALNLQLHRNIDLSTSNAAMSAEGRSDSLTFNFQVFAEPRLPFLTMGEVRIEAAYDSEKNSMLVPAIDEGNLNNFNNMRFGGGRRYYGGGGNKQMTMQASVSLQRTSQKATTLKELRGVLPVSLLVEQKPMPIAEKILTAKGKKSTIGDLEFHIETVTKKPNNLFEIKFSIANKGNLNDYNWMNNIYQRLELVDAKGEKFQNQGSNWHGSNGNSVTLTLTYGNGGRKMGDPDRFLFQHWVTRQHDINFVFREVPLP